VKRRVKASYAVHALRKDLAARIRRAEWVTGRKRAEVKDESRKQYRLPTRESWGQIVKAMR